MMIVLAPTFRDTILPYSLDQTRALRECHQLEYVPMNASQRTAHEIQSLESDARCLEWGGSEAQGEDASRACQSEAASTQR